MKVPLYVITGFLESGKTSFIKEMLEDPNFTENEKSLLLVCEEGEEEYDPAMLEKYHTVMVSISNEEELTSELLKKLQSQYKPERVLVEYNGMWKMSTLLDAVLPKSWFFYQVVSIVDASTFDTYLANMRGIFMDFLSNSEMAIFNRCTDESRIGPWRRTVRAMNRRAATIFLDEVGNPIENEDEALPYDINAPVIHLEDEDYGTWYIDASSTPEKYTGKQISFKAIVYKDRKMPKNTFVPGRFAMVCCVDDVSFMGFIGKYDNLSEFKVRDWVQVTAEIRNEYYPEYQGKGPVLYVSSMEKCQPPKEEMVYFNS